MSQIGRYEIVRKTGNHGLDALYEAFDPVSKKPVLIRMPDRAREPSVATNSADHPVGFDARQIEVLDHPHIVRVLACEEAEDGPFLVLEQAKGKPLSRLIQDKGLEAEQAIEFLKEAASALDHVHAYGLVHAHLTTECLFISDDGHLKVSGFDVARPADVLYADPSAMHFGALMSAVRNMSPELIQGELLDGRADQFSLACILIEALTGEPLFQARSPLSQMQEIVFGNPNLTDAVRRKGLPAPLANILDRAMAKSPAARFENCQEFLAAAETALFAKPVSAPTRFANRIRSATVAVRSASERKRYRQLLIAGVVVGLLLGTTIVYLLFWKSPAVPSPKTTQPPVVTPAPAPL